jgi:polyhydroxyalkanoate synthesis regulator phasin
MAEPASDRNPLETLGLAGVGAVALVAQHADELATEIGNRLGVERDEVRAAISDIVDSWRREAGRLGETGGNVAARAAAELGTASREVVDELELRVAQLEHRMRLLERNAGS